MIKKIKKLLFNESLKYTIISALSSALNYFTTIIYGKLFSVADYGRVSAIQAFVSNLAIFVAPLQIMLCKYAANSNFKDRSKGIFGLILYVNAFITTFLIVCFVPIANYLEIGNIRDYTMFSVLVISNNSLFMLNGILQGQMRFFFLGTINVILYFLKLVLSIFFYYMGLEINSVILAFLIADIVSLSFVMVSLIKKDRLSIQLSFGVSRTVIADYIWMFALYIVVSFFMNSGDILIGNFICDKNDVGLYSAVSNLAKISVYLFATPIATVILPRIVKMYDTNEQTILLTKAIVLFGLLASVYGFILVLNQDFIITMMYTKAYIPGGKYIISSTIFSITLGLFWIFYQYTIATDVLRLFTISTIIFAILSMIIVKYVVSSMIGIQIAMILAMVGSCMTIVIYRFYNSR